jgi:hypothetical protein
MKKNIRSGFLVMLASLAVLGIVMTSGSCQAVSIGANPSSIAADVDRGSLYNCTLYIFNLDKTATMDCEVYVDDEYASWVTFNQTSLTIEADSYKMVEFEMRPPAESSATNVSFYIYILGTSSGAGGTPISAGLKVPVTAELSEPSPSGLPMEMIAIITVAAVGVAAVSVFALKKKGIIKLGRGGDK